MNVKKIPVASLHEFPGNPQKQSAGMFRLLVDEIKNDGFDQPLLVIQHPDDPKAYYVVSGNHRLKALKELEATDADCVLKPWTMDEAKLKLVQRNVLHGDTDQFKFQALVDDVMGATAMPLADIATAMGFDDYARFSALLSQDEVITLGSNPKSPGTEPATSTDGLVDSLYKVVERILHDGGDTVADSYIWFTHRGKIHLMTDMDDRLKELFASVTEHCLADSMNINEVLTRYLEQPLMDGVIVDGADMLEFNDE